MLLGARMATMGGVKTPYLAFSANRNQGYIDTGIQLQPEYYYEFGVRIPTYYAEWVFMLGAGKSDNSTDALYWRNSASSQTTLVYGMEARGANAGDVVGTVFRKLEFFKKQTYSSTRGYLYSIYVDGSLRSSIIWLTESAITYYGEIFIGAVGKDDGTPSSYNTIPFDITYFKVMNQSGYPSAPTTVFDGVPAENNGTAGIYDQITGTFHSAVGEVEYCLE